jgi:hypothetical protein
VLLLPKPLLLLNITSVPDKKKVDWRLTNALDRIRNGGSPQFTCFTGTKVQILTLRAADFGTPWSFEGLFESLLYLLYWYKSTDTDAARGRFWDAWELRGTVRVIAPRKRFVSRRP